MAPVFKEHEGIESIALIGNYLPRMCGIATFTTDLTELPNNCLSGRILPWSTPLNRRPFSTPRLYRIRIRQMYPPEGFDLS